MLVLALQLALAHPDPLLASGMRLLDEDLTPPALTAEPPPTVAPPSPPPPALRVARPKQPATAAELQLARARAREGMLNGWLWSVPAGLAFAAAAAGDSLPLAAVAAGAALLLPPLQAARRAREILPGDLVSAVLVGTLVRAAGWAAIVLAARSTDSDAARWAIGLPLAVLVDFALVPQVTVGVLDRTGAPLAGVPALTPAWALARPAR